jgi:hypothetical protein
MAVSHASPPPAVPFLIVAINVSATAVRRSGFTEHPAYPTKEYDEFPVSFIRSSRSSEGMLKPKVFTA